MKCSKVFLLLGLVAAVVLLISSEVAARDLAAETSTENEVDDVEPDPFGGGFGSRLPPVRFRPPRGGFRGRCPHGCHCLHGCCGIFRCRCCASAAEAAQFGAEAKPQN